MAKYVNFERQRILKGISPTLHKYIYVCHLYFGFYLLYKKEFTYINIYLYIYSNL